MVQWRHRLLEPVTVLLITLFTGLVSQRWTGLDTPDSSFYASLGIFGDDVSDRAPENSYYWTRLGVIVPRLVLTELAGIWPGLALHRMLLLLLLVIGVYVTLRRFTGVPTAAFLTTITSLSTVVLSYLGNPFPTATVLAGTSIVIACAMFDGWRSAAIAGATLGWLAMSNPPGVLLAGTVWLVLRLQARTRVGPLLVAAGAAAATFAGFWLVGRRVFPRMDWLGAYLESNARLDYSVFASKDAVWLGDISLIVPASVFVICVLAWWMHREQVAAQRALVISSSSVAFLLVFTPMFGGIPLEAPMYQAMLWPPALVALALVATLALPAGRWSWPQVGAGALGIVVVIAAGFSAPGLGLGAGWLLAAGLVAAFLVLPRLGALAAITGVVVLLAGAQLLQNSRGDLGLYYLSPYHWAFSSNPISERMHTAVNAQEWLLASTEDTDRILLWVGGDWVDGDRELYVVAGMQLWGENRVTLAPTMDDDGLARLAAAQPSVVAMYAPTMDAVDSFWASIPRELFPTAPDCYDFTWASNPASPHQVTQGHACLTRITWEG